MPRKHRTYLDRMDMEELLAERSRRENELRDHQKPENKERLDKEEYTKKRRALQKAVETIRRYIANYDSRRAELAVAFPLEYTTPVLVQLDDEDNDQSRSDMKQRSVDFHQLKYLCVDSLTSPSRQHKINEYHILRHNRFVLFPNKAAKDTNRPLYTKHGDLVNKKLQEIVTEKIKEESPILLTLSEEGYPAGLELLNLTNAMWKLNQRFREVLDDNIPHDEDAEVLRSSLNGIPLLKAALLPTPCEDTIGYWYQGYLRNLHAQQERLCRSCIKLTSSESVNLLAERYKNEAALIPARDRAEEKRKRQILADEEAGSLHEQYTFAKETSLVSTLISLSMIDTYEGQLCTIHLEEPSPAPTSKVTVSSY
jgi:hypothetical protein